MATVFGCRGVTAQHLIPHGILGLSWATVLDSDRGWGGGGGGGFMRGWMGEIRHINYSHSNSNVANFSIPKFNVSGHSVTCRAASTSSELEQTSNDLINQSVCGVG